MKYLIPLLQSYYYNEESKDWFINSCNFSDNKSLKERRKWLGKTETSVTVFELYNRREKNDWCIISFGNIHLGWYSLLYASRHANLYLRGYVDGMGSCALQSQNTKNKYKELHRIRACRNKWLCTYTIWWIMIMHGQGYPNNKDRLFQDNQNTMKIKINQRKSYRGIHVNQGVWWKSDFK